MFSSQVGNKPMKLLLLNIHLERNHNMLKKLVEMDSRPGMDEVRIHCGKKDKQTNKRTKMLTIDLYRTKIVV